MKHTILLTLHSSLLILNLSAAVPLSWTVETTRAQPATFEAYQGETLTFEAALTCRGKPLEAPLNYSFFWQTNGMGSTYWEAPCSRGGDIPVAASTNVLFATWLPAYDVGAKVYNCFIGSPSNIYHAAFQLRLRPSPGALPNALPLPTPVIDFAKVRVLNPPWGGGGVDTNTVRDIIHATVDGAAHSLPKYLHALDFDDAYTNEAAAYYRSRGDGKTDGGCSAVRSGGYLSRNFDFPFDSRSEFVVKMSAGKDRFASVGVAQVGTNLTEQMVTSGKPEFSARYKWLPGATVDGVNEYGVVAEINVVDGNPQTSGWRNMYDIHPLGAVRWALDNGKTAEDVATNLAARITFPSGWAQNFHWMIADERETWIVENGEAHQVTNRAVMTNFRLYPKTYGAGWERYMLLEDSFANITNAWYTRAYERDTEWVSEFRDLAEMEAAKTAWETHAREQLRGHGLWQSVHTSVYDISNRVLRVAVQETDDWYTFQVPPSGVKVETDPTVPAWAKEATPPQTMTTNAVERIANAAVTTNALVVAATNRVAALAIATNNLTSTVSSLQSSKVDKVKNPAPVVDNLAALTADGGIKDSGIAKTSVAKKTDLGGYLPLSGGTMTGPLGVPSIGRRGFGDDMIVLRDPSLPDCGLLFKNPKWYYGYPMDAGRDSAEIAVKGDIPAPYVPSAADTNFSNAVMGVASHTNDAFAAEVLAVQVASLSTNITEEVYIAATNACANLGIDPSLIPQGGTLGTVGGLLVALAAAVALLRKQTQLLESDGKATDDFATDLMGKQVAKSAIDNRTNASASAIAGDALTLPDGGVVSASSSAPTITFGTARQDGLRFCELYLTNPDTTTDGAIVSISGKVYSDISLTDLPKLEKGATYYFTFAEFKVDNGVSWWKVSKQKLDTMGGDIPTPTAA